MQSVYVVVARPKTHAPFSVLFALSSRFLLLYYRYALPLVSFARLSFFPGRSVASNGISWFDVCLYFGFSILSSRHVRRQRVVSLLLRNLVLARSCACESVETRASIGYSFTSRAIVFTKETSFAGESKAPMKLAREA